MSGEKRVLFYDQWEAFPHTRVDGTDNRICVSVHPNGEGEGGNYDFTIVGVGTGPKYREYIAPKVSVFSDAWRVFADLPELFDALAAHDMSNEARAAMPLPSVIDLLTGLGYTNITPKYADQHHHTYSCYCGARATAAPAQPVPGDPS